MRAFLLRGAGRINGDGWKDTTTVGEVVFVYPRELPAPYRPGQFERVGNPGWTATTRQYDFQPASIREVLRLLPTLIKDRPKKKAYAFRWLP